MTIKSPLPQPTKHANIALSALPGAIRKLKRRLEEVAALEPHSESDFPPLSQTISDKVNATFSDIYGVDTVEAADSRILPANFLPNFAPCSLEDRRKIFLRAKSRVIAKIQAAIDIFSERIEDGEEDATGRTLQAYNGLELHPEIARAATDLYRNGHYANAVELLPFGWTDFGEV